MSDITFERTPQSKQKTTGSQWLVIGLVVVLYIVLWIILWFVLVNQLFGGSGAEEPEGPTPGCSPSVNPTGLVASQPNITVPSIHLEWNAVLNPQTPGEIILGYNVYSRETAGITKSNSAAVRSSTFTIDLNTSGSGEMTSGTEVFFRVSTVDTCGEGELGSEISFTPV